jgi:hypothetical protein
VNLSDFTRETVNEFLKQLLFFKKFHEKLTKQVKKIFDLEITDKDLHKFILRRLKRVVSLEMLSENNEETLNEFSMISKSKDHNNSQMYSDVK